MISLLQRPLPDNTQHSQQTKIHAPGGIRTRNPSKRSAVDHRLTTLGQWHRLLSYGNNTNSGHRMSSGGLLEVKSVTVTVFQFIVYRPVSLYVIRDVFRSQRDILEIYSIVSWLYWQCGGVALGRGWEDEWCDVRVAESKGRRNWYIKRRFSTPNKFWVTEPNKRKVSRHDSFKVW